VRWAALLLPLLVLAHGAAAEPRVATDDRGEVVRLTAPARRIVSLAPNATEMTYAAGAGSALVGAVGSSDFPAAARALPRVGDAFGLDVERIVALRPDLVLTWPYTVPAQLATLRARGVRVFTIDSRQVDDIASAIERIGILAGTEQVAAPAARTLRQRARELEARYRDRPPVRVFYEVWATPLVTLGGTHLVSRAMETCGGRNVFASLSTPAPTVSIEAVLASAPDAIVAGGDAGARPEWLEEWRRWPALPAVSAGNLFAIDADHLHRAGPRFLQGVADLCAILDSARRNLALRTAR